MPQLATPSLSRIWRVVSSRNRSLRHDAVDRPVRPLTRVAATGQVDPERVSHSKHCGLPPGDSLGLVTRRRSGGLGQVCG